MVNGGGDEVGLACLLQLTPAKAVSFFWLE
jgi:hypothetical protein